VREGKLTDEQFARYEQAAVEIANLPIEYIDQPTTLQDTERFLSRKNSPTLWWALDYAQIHPVGGGITAGDRAAMNMISGTMRSIAKNVAPGLVLSQMTREVDKREDKRPQLADLLGTGQFEADASVVLGIYRGDVYNRVADEERDEPRPAELLLLKQRNGPTNRTIDMLWHPTQMHFQDISDLLVED
jgi:replicative DNA helicase